MNSNEKRKVFTIRSNVASSYIVFGDNWTTHESVWISQKCWFVPGTSVIITDEDGNSKRFTRLFD